VRISGVEGSLCRTLSRGRTEHSPDAWSRGLFTFRASGRTGRTATGWLGARLSAHRPLRITLSVATGRSAEL